MKKLLIISILFISLFSCRTVKKEWVKETFAEKQDLKKLEQDVIFSNERIKSELKQDYTTYTDKKIKEVSSKTSTTENENTVISGSVEAEPGVTKTFEGNGVKITTDGWKVNFETNLSKSLSKEFETKLETVYKKFDSIVLESQQKETEISSLKTRLTTLENRIDTKNESWFKTVSKKQLGFGVFIFLIVLVLGYLGYRYVKRKTDWLV